MTEEQIKFAVIELLYDLHSINTLNLFILDSISRNFKVNAEALCDQHGITYKLE